MSLLNDILRNAVAAKASDVHINVGLPPMFRVHTIMKASDFPIVTPEGAIRILKEMVNEKRYAEFEVHRDADFSYEIPGVGRYRVNAHFQRNTVALAFRTINDKVRPLEELFLPDIVNKLTYLPRGLIICTGPTGSGKSTTLAAMIDSINGHRRAHILTLEDPIEYVHDHKLSMVNQRELGTDCDSFARGLRSALREDPDVVLVGEMRDPETIAAVLTIAETGHLVFSTLHTNDAGQSIDRIVDVFSADRQNQIRIQLAGSLVGICSQRLLPRVDGGLVAAFEVLVSTYAVGNLVREGKSGQLRNQIATGTSFGMFTLENSLSELVRAGIVSYDEASSHSHHPKELDRRNPGA